MKQVEWLCDVIGRYERLVYAALVGLLLWPVWANAYFLTLDGPSHLYNAWVLRDYWHGTNTAFFARFYTINPHIDPNWFSHIALACLMELFTPPQAEKILLSTYVICLLLFSRWLIIYINKDNKLLSFLPFLFVYNHVLQMGFYNFSFSMAFMILTWLFFLKYLDKISAYLSIPAGALLFILTYLAHPLGYIICCAALFLIYLLDGLLLWKSGREFIKQMAKRYAVVFAAMVPSLCLLLYFVLHHPGYAGGGQRDMLPLLSSLVHLSAIVNLVAGEYAWARVTFFFMAALLAIGAGIKISSRKINRYDAFFILTLLLAVLYVAVPRTTAGVATVYERYQIMPFLVLPFWLASVALPRWLAALSGLISIVIVTGLMLARIPAHSKCSDAVEEFMSAEKYIPAKSTVLPLCYALSGKQPDGSLIANRAWVFNHAADYLGTKKPLILMGNYEGNTGFFPLLWRPEMNPFEHLPAGGDGIEDIPPHVDINKYERQTGAKIAYVLLQCLDSETINHPNTVELFKQLQAGYTLIYTSTYKRAILYRRNDIKETSLK